MRFYLFVVLVAFLGVPCLAQNAPNADGQPPAQGGPKAQLFFKESSHDFGSIAQGDKVEYVFEYTNNGQAPLIISNVQTTCGCTASQWSRAPLAPGKTSKLTATFDSKGKVGRQNKVISIFSNASNPEERVRIVANVLPPEQPAAPDTVQKN
jgi:hypothetical protein